MNEMVQIRSVKHYFNEFIIKGLEGKTNIQEVDLIGIKQNILEAFRKEVFGQLIFKLGPECAEMSTKDLADMNGVQNILQQAFRKWRRLCMLCSEHGLGNFFQLEDLKNILEDQTTVRVPDPEEDVTGELPEGTVISKDTEDGRIEPDHIVETEVKTNDQA